MLALGVIIPDREESHYFECVHVVLSWWCCLRAGHLIVSWFLTMQGYMLGLLDDVISTVSSCQLSVHMCYPVNLCA